MINTYTAPAQLIVNYPKQLPDSLQQTIQQFEHEAKMALAVKLFELKRISSGVAAQLVGIDRVTFLLELHHYQVAIHDLTDDELLADVENA
jgi:predicted HTH domain antitoxin